MNTPANHTAPLSVPILIGAPAALVGCRELRNKYMTNRDIKTYAAFFLLKTLSTTGVIQEYENQMGVILPLIQCNKQTAAARVKEMAALGLCKLTIVEVSNNCYLTTIHLVSYKEAAAKLGIKYNGLINIIYDQEKKGNQIFQYLIRTVEIADNAATQLEAIHYKLNKNPLLKSNLMHLLMQQGADEKKLHTSRLYFQKRFLLLQQQAFKDGTELEAVIYALRADTNRSAGTIKSHHCYKSAASVTYLKKRMQDLKLITVTRMITESDCRQRLYRDGGDAYKWAKGRKITLLRQCDQIEVKVQTLTAVSPPHSVEASQAVA
jgi:hypothetical protein